MRQGPERHLPAMPLCLRAHQSWVWTLAPSLAKSEWRFHSHSLECVLKVMHSLQQFTHPCAQPVKHETRLTKIPYPVVQSCPVYEICWKGLSHGSTTFCGVHLVPSQERAFSGATVKLWKSLLGDAMFAPPCCLAMGRQRPGHHDTHLKCIWLDYCNQLYMGLPLEIVQWTWGSIHNSASRHFIL